MVNEITPTYYAAGRYKAEYKLRGFNLELIPTDAVGVLSSDNARPLMHRDVTDASLVMNVESVDTCNLTLSQDSPHQHSLARYLGAILSADRQTVLWENTTQPLPTT